MPVLICRQVSFYSNGDELAFFGWLGKVKAIRQVVGAGDAIHLHVTHRLSDKTLRELLAIFYRYRIDMTQLAQFKSSTNRHWFADPTKYWHKRTFKRISSRNATTGPGYKSKITLKPREKFIHPA